MSPIDLFGLSLFVTICETVDYSVQIGKKLTTKLGLGRLVNGNKNKKMKKCLILGLDAVIKSENITNDVIKSYCLSLKNDVKTKENEIVLKFIEAIRSNGSRNSKNILSELLFFKKTPPITLVDPEYENASDIFRNEVNSRLLEIYSEKEFNLLILDIFLYQNSQLDKFDKKLEDIISITRKNHRLSTFIDRFGEYQEILKENIRINLKWLLTERDFLIKDLWTELRFTPLYLREVKEESLSLSISAKWPDEKEYSNYQLILKIVESFPRILIFGIGGSGKSTLLKYLETKLLSHDPKERILPIRISLYEFSASILNNPGLSLEDFIISTFLGKSNVRMPFDITLNEISSCFNLWLLLDAVDEIKYLQEEKAFLKLDVLLKAHPVAKVVITSRPTAKLIKKIQNFPRLEIKKLELYQISEYYNKILKNVFNEPKYEEKANQILKNLSKSKIRPAVNTFLMAALYTIVYRESIIQKSQTKFEFLKRATEYMLSKWDEVNERFDIIYYNTEKILPPEFLEKIVTNLAYNSLNNPSPNSLGFTTNNVHEIVNKAFKERFLRNTTEIAKVLILYLRERAGFLTDTLSNDEYLAFPHRIIRDFFAMIHIKGTYNRSKKFFQEFGKNQLKNSVYPLVISGFYDQRQYTYSKRLIKEILRNINNIEDFALIDSILSELIDLGVDLLEILPIKDILKLLKSTKILYIDEFDKLIEESEFIQFILNLNWIDIKKNSDETEWSSIALIILKIAMDLNHEIEQNFDLKSMLQTSGYDSRLKIIKIDGEMVNNYFLLGVIISGKPEYIETLIFADQITWNKWKNYLVTAETSMLSEFIFYFSVRPLKYQLNFKLTPDDLMVSDPERGVFILILLLVGLKINRQDDEVISNALHRLLVTEELEWPDYFTRQIPIGHISSLKRELEDNYFDFQDKNLKISRYLSIISDLELSSTYIDNFPVLGNFTLIKYLITLYETISAGRYLKMTRKEFITRITNLVTWSREMSYLFYSN